MRKRLHLDLFSGIGGFALAAGWAGFETAMFCEIDPFARKVLAKHWPEVPIHDDIHTLTADVVGQPIDLITGGFPCQPFSVAGKRRGQEDDRHLWPEMARLIGACRPRWVLGENTPGIIGLALDDCLADLESLGYEAWPVVIPACGVGAWHRRERVWIVAHAEREQSKQQGGVSERGRRWASGGGQAGIRGVVADAECGGWREQVRTHTAQRAFSQAIGEEGTSGIRPSGSNVADSAGIRERKQADETNAVAVSGEAWEIVGGGNSHAVKGWPTDDADRGRYGPSNELVSAGRDGTEYASWWELESRVRGVPDGLSTGVDGRAARLKALGNAIVPQVAYEILREMAA